MARILIGTSGWAYARWKGCFYPLRLPEKQRLSFYADRFRIAIEFRHASWFTAETYRLLTQYEAALCIADGPRYPRCNVITTDFAYFRYHGRTPASAPYYPDEELRAEAQLVERFAKDGIDCYGYFNNDADGHAATNARRLNELLSDRQCAA